MNHEANRIIEILNEAKKEQRILKIEEITSIEQFLKTIQKQMLERNVRYEHDMQVLDNNILKYEFFNRKN